MKKAKYLKKKEKRFSWLIVVLVILIGVAAAALLILKPWQSGGTESQPDPTVQTHPSTEAPTLPPETVPAETEPIVPEPTEVKLENNPFLLDLSCSGMITMIDGSLCFVSDQMYSVDLNGVVRENVNIFRLNDPNLKEWAEETVIIRASSMSSSGEDIVLGLQYLVWKDICISTPFATFHFPAEWADNLSVTHSFSESGYQIDFYANIDEIREYLFTITLGESDGTPVGKLTDSMDAVTMVYVSARAEDFSAHSQTRQEYLERMMDGMNYLLDELGNNPSFSGEF